MALTSGEWMEWVGVEEGLAQSGPCPLPAPARSSRAADWCGEGRLEPGKVPQMTGSGRETSLCESLCSVVSGAGWTWTPPLTGEDVLAHVGERLAVLVLPRSDPVRVPDLHAVESADHDHLAAEAGVLLEQRRDRDPPLLVGLVLGGPHRQEPAVLTRLADGERGLLEAVGHGREVGDREDVEAEVLTLGHHESLRELVPELGGQEEPVLLVQLGGVGAHEHPGTSTWLDPSSTLRHCTPLCSTVNHIRPCPRGIRRLKRPIPPAHGRVGPQSRRGRDRPAVRRIRAGQRVVGPRGTARWSPVEEAGGAEWSVPGPGVGRSGGGSWDLVVRRDARSRTGSGQFATEPLSRESERTWHAPRRLSC